MMDEVASSKAQAMNNLACLLITFSTITQEATLENTTAIFGGGENTNHGHEPSST